MTLLVLSTAVLGIGPLLGWLLRASAMGLQLLDGFVFAAILGLAVFQLLPEALERAGALSLLTAAVGVLGPLVVETRLGQLSRKTHGAVLGLTMLGLAAHEILDGAALAAGHASPAMALAVVLHRVPIGMLVWWAVRPAFGGAAALAALGLIAAATAAGYVFLGPAFRELEGPLAGHLMALVAGSILHVVLHQTGPEGFSTREENCPYWAGAGALAAIVMLCLVPGGEHGHGHGVVAHAPGVADVFLGLVYESAPALLLGFLLAGLVHGFLPEAGIEWLSRGGRFSQALRGMLFGLPLPICSCGVVPVYESLIARGAPVAAGVAFLVATPQLGLDTFLLSIPLLGLPMALTLLGGAIVVAVFCGAVLGGLLEARAPGSARADGAAEGDSCCAHEEHGAGEGPAGGRLEKALRHAFVELVDHTGPWIAAGLAVAALAGIAVDFSAVVGLPPALQILVLTLASIPVYVCASAATPVAAMLLAKGVAPGAVVALLLAGPATNMTTFALLRRLHGDRGALAFTAALVASAVGVAGLAQVAFGAWSWVPPRLPDGHGAGRLELAAAVVLGLLAAAALVRQGPRGLAAQLLPAEDHDHGHHGHACEEAPIEVPHDHGCSHDHGCA